MISLPFESPSSFTTRSVMPLMVSCRCPSWAGRSPQDTPKPFSVGGIGLGWSTAVVEADFLGGNAFWGTNLRGVIPACTVTQNWVMDIILLTCTKMKTTIVLQLLLLPLCFSGTNTVPTYIGHTSTRTKILYHVCIVTTITKVAYRS